MTNIDEDNNVLTTDQIKRAKDTESMEVDIYNLPDRKKEVQFMLDGLVIGLKR